MTDRSATPGLDQAALEEGQRLNRELEARVAAHQQHGDEYRRLVGWLTSHKDALLAAAEERERLESQQATDAEAFVTLRRELNEARARAEEAEKQVNTEVEVVNRLSEHIERLEAALREELDGERLACEVYSVPQVDCGHCWGCRVRQALAASGATAIRVRYDSSTGRPLPEHDAAGQQQEDFKWHVLSECPDEEKCPIHGRNTGQQQEGE
jgi:DNA repair exonuclease SbcCD ATPase subunit